MEERPAKRFKHQSLKQTLKEVHPSSALKRKVFEEDIPDTASHFHDAIERWRELNLSPAFIRFTDKVEPLSASMPLLLHHWKEVTDAWLVAVDGADDEALRAILDLFQHLSHDLRTTLAPLHAEVLDALLKLLPRSLSALTVTALLETFASVLKYVTIPSDVVEETWKAFQGVLPKCNPEVQRAVAELWGTTLRRLKLPVREKCSILMAEWENADVSAWILVSACKSVSHTLHTSTPTIFRPISRHSLSCENFEHLFTVLRRLLTALVHHCSTPEQFSPLADILVETLSSANLEETESLRRLLELITVPCSVRRGSRLTAKQLSALVSRIPSLPLSDDLHSSILKFTTACLLAGDMALAMGPGRKVFERIWEFPEFALGLCGVLSDLNWGGWKLIALPHVLKHTRSLLQNHPVKMLQLLSALHREGRLESVDSAWRQSFETWVDERFGEWDGSDERMVELHHVLSISDLHRSINSLLTRVIEKALETSEPVLEFEKSPTNSAWLLGSCLKCLAKREVKEWSGCVDISAWTRVILEKWAWCGFVLEGLNSLIHASPTKSQHPLSDVLPSPLLPSLLSHSRLLRLSVLRLLSSSLFQVPTGTAAVLNRCLQGEEVSIDVQGVRERVLKMKRLSQVLQDSDDVGAGIAVRWLISQLKVNLRPLWTPAAEALSTLAERFGGTVWDLVFQEVEVALGSSGSVSSPSWMAHDQHEDLDDIREEERTWRDPSAHKFRLAVAGWLRSDNANKVMVEMQAIEERFDAKNYKLQLLGALAVFPTLVEKHSRTIIPLFLSLDPISLARHELKAWLELFAEFVNPKAMYSTEKMRSLYTSLLSHPDRPLQRLALTCLLTYKSPHILSHEDTLRTLLDDTRWRDELTKLDLENLEDGDRPDLVGVIIRLLFGVMLEKKGKARGADRRTAVLSSLGGCTDDELHLLVELMLKPINMGRESHPEGEYVTIGFSEEVTSRQMVGFLTLLGDVVKNLGTRLVGDWPVLLGALLDVVGYAQGRIQADKEGENGDDGDAGADVDPDAEEDEHTAAEEPSGSTRGIRTVRQLGLKRFADFFRCPVTFDFSPYMKEAFRSSISPRLPSLDTDSAQAPSALLELFYAWSTRAETASFLTCYDDLVLPKAYGCLVAPNVKPPVVAKVMDIVESLLTLSSSDDSILSSVFKPHVALLLTNLSTWIERSKALASLTDTLGRRQISILSKIAPYLTDSAQASILLSVFLPLLRKPSKLLPEKIKVDLVNITSNLLPLVSDLSDTSSIVYTKTYSAVSSLFQSLRSRQGRIATTHAFRSFSSTDGSLSVLVDFLDDLNAYSVKRIDEPDFDRRLGAFNRLNENLHSSLSCKEWLPILYNMLNFIQDPDELTIRSNAALALKRFVDRVAAPDPEFEATFLKVLYPGLKNGLRSKNELVRAEILGVISHAVSTCDKVGSLQDMRPLLAAGDEEANFFNNIHHVQVHRRTRALRRLVEQCDEDHLRSAVIADIFIPLVENFIMGAGKTDHILVNEAIVAVGRMSGHLSWGPYHALIQRYLRLTRSSDALGRAYTRTIVAVLDNFHFEMDAVLSVSEREQVPEEEDEEDVAKPSVTVEEPKVHSHIADIVNSRLLPNLLHHLERRDEAEEALRIPIAVGIAHVALHLPQQSRDSQISRLLTVLSQILRSKSQETRDLTRETLCRIAVAAGPAHLPTLFRELRAALTRGPQLHVLAFVVHSLLVHVTTGDHASTFHTLDDCVNDASHVAAEVVFGESGKDVLAEEFKTKMREVRGSASRGLDTFAILAKFITPHKVSNLLLPVRNILHETETLRVMQQVEDLLRRVASGLNTNDHLIPKELLVLCHTLISQNSRFLKQAPNPSKGKKRVRGDAIVQLKRTHGPESDHYANNSFRFVIFGLDLFNTAHKRSRFDFKDPEIISRLESMVPVIGNTLYSTHMQVIIPALKAATAILKCPLSSVDKSLPVIIRQILDIVKQAGSTESEAAQTAIKSLATILRDIPTAQVKEKDLVSLLELLSPDLEEPARQASVFRMLRAIVARRFVVPEIYDIMDKVSEIMVTNQSPQVQELCRGVLLQFLLDYPQGKGRLRNHMTFLAKNLSYVYESGRKSVMDFLDAILLKFNPSLLREYSDLLFVALVMVIANDDAAKCREMASELIKNLFSRLDDPQRRVVVSHIHSWATQHSQPQLQRVSSQIYSIIVDLLNGEISPYASAIVEDTTAILESSAESLETATSGEDDGMDIDTEWQIPYHALIALSKVLQACPELTTQAEAVKWPTIVSHLLFPHTWVRSASCRLVGILFAAVPVAAPDEKLPDDSVFSLVGLEDVAKKFCLQLRGETLDGVLSTQVVKNLFYIGRCFCAIDLPKALHSSLDKSESDSSDASEDEEHEDQEVTQHRHPLHWLFSKLSYQARSAHIARRNKSTSPDNWYHQPASVFRWFAAMVAFMESEMVERFLTHILAPVYRIAEDDTIRDAHMEELKTLALELQEMVQTKVGTTRFATAYGRIRQQVVGIRRERRIARAVQVTTNPAAAAKRKMSRNISKRDNRKRKNHTFTEGKRFGKRRKAD